MELDPARDYPLGSKRPDLVETPGGIPLAEITLAALREGRIDADELRATPATLGHQAAVARAAGRPQLAESLERASELAAIPSETILEIYTALRPRRSTAAALEGWAERLDAWGAPRTAAFVREAKDVYLDRGLLLEDA